MSDPLRMKLPLAIVTGIVSAAAAGGGAWAVASERIATHEARLAHVEERQTAQDREHEETRIRTTRLEDALTNVSDMVKEIRTDVKDLKRGR